MKKTDIQQALDDNIPGSTVAHRQQSGVELSYLETWYVIDRLNQVLGQGNWSYQTAEMRKVFEGEIEQRAGKVYSASYVATVNVFVNIEGRQVFFSDVGFGTGTHKTDPGGAHELATKGAVSDGLKRAAKNLGRSMGLALYDKTQEYVGNIDTGKSNTRVSESTPESKTSPPIVAEASKAKPIDNVVNNRPKPIKELITSAFKVLEAQKKITKEEFQTKYLNGGGLSKVAVADMPKIYETLKSDFPHLNIIGGSNGSV